MNKQLEKTYNKQQYQFKTAELSFDKFFQQQKKRKEAFNKKYNGKKIDYRFQELGVQMQNWFQKNIWWIFYQPYAQLDEVEKAFNICKKKGIKEPAYLIGILKNDNPKTNNPDASQT